MRKSKAKLPISDLLRRTIKESGVPLLVLERETGVTRASIRRFVNGQQTLRLDMADKLASYFKLGLLPLMALGEKSHESESYNCGSGNDHSN